MKIQSLFAIVLFLFAAPTVVGAGDSHDHHHGGSSADLKLDHGKKWETDESLRDGMKNIQMLLKSNLSAIHNRKFKATDYEGLAVQINANTTRIFQKCKLRPEADAMLHIVLAKILGGAGQMKTSKTLEQKRAGAVQIMSAMGDYEKFFEHPGWQPLQH